MQFTQLEIIIRGPILFSHPQKWWISCQGRSYNTSPTPRSSASATSIMIYTISNPSPHLQSVVHRATWARSACHRDERCNAEQFYIWYTVQGAKGDCQQHRYPASGETLPAMGELLDIESPRRVGGSSRIFFTAIGTSSVECVNSRQSSIMGLLPLWHWQRRWAEVFSVQSAHCVTLATMPGTLFTRNQVLNLETVKMCYTYAVICKPSARIQVNTHPLLSM